MHTVEIPARLQASCRDTAARDWLADIPAMVEELRERWDLVTGRPFPADASWVAPATTADGAEVVLKIGLPHFEADGEAAALRFWSGEPTVRLLAADDVLGAMVLERCTPGTPLDTRPASEQTTVSSDLLRRLWRPASAADGFRPLSEMLDHWAQEALENRSRWLDPGLVREGLALFTELSRTTTEEVLLATDLHAGNALKSERRPWLVIDPKPFVGDPAYDATQHLLNHRRRLRDRPDRTIAPFAEALGVDPARVTQWLFARAAAGPSGGWADPESLDLARRLAR